MTMSCGEQRFAVSRQSSVVTPYLFRLYARQLHDLAQLFDRVRHERPEFGRAVAHHVEADLIETLFHLAQCERLAVFAGANRPCQLASISMPVTPDSTIVGTSGRNLARLVWLYASARSLPDLICAMDSGGVAIIIWISPASRAVIAGPAPLYGTCTMSVPARALKSAPDRWMVLPTPGEPYETRAPGLRVWAINSLTVVTPSELFTTRMCASEPAIWVMGAKSLSASNGSFL